MRVGFIGLIVAVFCGLAAPSAHAARSFHTFVVSEVFTSVDGAVQFVELREAFGLNGQQFLAGHALTSTNASGTMTNVFTFPNNLPNSSTAGKRVLIATAGFGSLPGGVTPDYIIPAGFLFTGGSVDFAAITEVNYASLPTNGQSSLVFPGGTVAVNSPTNYLGNAGSVNVPGGSCCNGTACAVTIAAACGGTFGPGGGCSPNPCAPPPTGACCDGTSCSVQAAASCSGGAQYQGDGSACGPTGNPTTCCGANFNQTGGVTVQDIFDFLGAYFNGDTAADFNQVGGITVQDIFDFLAAYFVGCPG